MERYQKDRMILIINYEYRPVFPANSAARSRANERLRAASARIKSVPGIFSFIRCWARVAAS